jgi:hypothetical protein
MTRGAKGVHIFGCCHFMYDMYMCTVHAVRPCAARVCVHLNVLVLGECAFRLAGHVVYC